MRKLCCVFLPFLLGALASAQIVHPNQYATSEGVTNNSWPYRFTNNTGYYQQTFDAAQFPTPITITEISYRYKGDNPQPSAPADFKMTLAYCATAWNAPSSVFATNIGANPTVVFDGIWTIQAFNGDPATPNPFTARLVLTTPFTYDPALGDLLIDIEMRASTYGLGGAAGAFARADSNTGVNRIYDNGNSSATSGSVSTVGLITEFTGTTCNGTYSFNGSGCRDSSGTALAMTASGCPDLGASFDIGCATGPAVQAPVILVMGVSDQLWTGIVLPLDLTPFGAPGCSVYTSHDAIFGPLVNPGGGASLSLPIPASPFLAGSTSHWQGYIIEQGLNPLSMGTSNYLSVTVQ